MLGQRVCFPFWNESCSNRHKSCLNRNQKSVFKSDANNLAKVSTRCLVLELARLIFRSFVYLHVIKRSFAVLYGITVQILILVLTVACTRRWLSWWSSTGTKCSKYSRRTWKHWEFSNVMGLGASFAGYVETEVNEDDEKRAGESSTRKVTKAWRIQWPEQPISILEKWCPSRTRSV